MKNEHGAWWMDIGENSIWSVFILRPTLSTLEDLSDFSRNGYDVSPSDLDSLENFRFQYGHEK